LFEKAAKIDGIEVNSPRQALRAAYQMGLISDIDIWFELLEDRNMTSHTYDQDIANKVYESAKRLPEELKNAIAGISESLC
jgi:nucleotidyltransferase substrate binding protein (TIGR01987 family)